MPIHDQGYRRYSGARTARGAGVGGDHDGRPADVLQRRTFSGCCCSSWLPFIVRTVQFYAAANFPQMAAIAPTAGDVPAIPRPAERCSSSLSRVYVGAGLIANDRRANALQIYLSKPLTRV